MYNIERMSIGVSYYEIRFPGNITIPSGGFPHEEILLTLSAKRSTIDTKHNGVVNHDANQYTDG